MESSFEVSEPETQFIPQEDDEETLWKVIEIIEEDKTSRRYKVKWDGINPKNGKPWAPGWVLMHDCTPDLVEAWQQKKKRKKRRSSMAPNLSRADLKSYKPSSRRESKASSSKTSPAKSTSTNRSSRRHSHSSTPKPTKPASTDHYDEWDEPPIAGPSKPNRNGKRRHDDPVEDDVSNDARTGSHSSTSSSRPTKKRKLAPESEVETDEEVRELVAKPVVSHKKATVQKKSFSTSTSTPNATPGPSKPVNGRRPSKFVYADTESESEMPEKEKAEKILRKSSGTGKPFVSINSPPKLKPSGSKAASGTKADKPAAKKWSHAPFGRSDSKTTSNEESLSDREGAARTPVPATTTFKPVKKASAERSKPKKSSITQRVVRKRPPPSPEVDEGLELEEDQLDAMDYNTPLEPLVEELNVDASEEDELSDGSEMLVPSAELLRHDSEGRTEEVADSEQQDLPSDPEADVEAEAEVDAREDEGPHLDRTRLKPKNNAREVSPVVDMADDGPGDKAGRRRSPTAVASTAPAAVPAKSVPSHQPSNSGSSRSKPVPKATTNAVAGPSRIGPASENATESSTLKIGPPKKVYSRSNGLSRDKPVTRDLPKVIAPITPPPRTYIDKSRLSPNALKQLAEFDAFMATLSPEPAPAVTLSAPVNGANVTDNHRHPPSPVPPLQNNVKARDKDIPPRPHSPSQAQVKDKPTSGHDTNPNGVVLEPEPLTSERLQPFNPSPSSPKRRTIKSQMKPRSPAVPRWDRRGQVTPPPPEPSKHAPMKPMQPMTPNRMNAMYNSVGKSLFEQQDSTIQQFSDGTEPSVSQISQFESPEKPQQGATPQKGGGLSSLNLEMKGSKRSNPSNRLIMVTEADVDVRQKGEALAEKHRKQMLLEMNSGEVQKKKVEDIQAERMNASGKGKTVVFVEPTPTPTPTPSDVPTEPPRYEDGDQDADGQEYRHHDFSQPTQAQETLQESQVQADDDEPSNEGRIHHPFSQPTQAPQQASQESHQTDDAQMDVDAEDFDDILQYPPDEDVSQQLEQAPALVSGTQESDSAMIVPATAPDDDTSLPSSHPTEAQIRRDPNVDAAMLQLLNHKSEEISRLEASLAEEREKAHILTQEVQSLKAQDALQEADFKRLGQELQAALTAAIVTKESAERDKIAAEKDKEIFREQYMRASDYAADSRKELADLNQRLEVAETQVKEGVNLVKRTYQTRVQDLEAESRKWQELFKFTVEREMRTNDDIRRQAAEAPELRRQNEELKAELENSEREMEDLHERYHQLEVQSESRAHILENEVAVWREEANKVRRERDDLVSRGVGQSFGANDMVFYCRWKTESGAQTCLEPFRTRAKTIYVRWDITHENTRI